VDILVLLTVAVLVGWLTTLLLHRKIDNVSLVDFAIAIGGAALTGGLLAPSLGIAITWKFGLTLAGMLASWAGAMSLLAIANLARFGTIQR
jgi:uncharacterized membrane protein YeaQ/YmgE (transglycosylase-associated protein family)